MKFIIEAPWMVSSQIFKIAMTVFEVSEVVHKLEYQVVHQSWVVEASMLKLKDDVDDSSVAPP